MKKALIATLFGSFFLYGEDITLQRVVADATYIDEVASEAKVSADLGEVLAKDIPSIDMSRRSAIANDIIIRGFKRDNVSVAIDGAKVYGACPNRMDPPISHVLTNNIQSVRVIEGPYDVTQYGTLGGGVKVVTKTPKKGWHGDVSFGGGSWNYQSLAASFTGGNDFIRVLVSASSQSSNQYKDANGNSLADQVENKATTNKYKSSYYDMQAYTKRSFMTKLFINPAENQEIRLGYTANRSYDVMYPNSPMDAIYDYSDIYSVAYLFKNIAPWYKELALEFYSTDVDHPMGTDYRQTMAVMRNHMYSSMDAWSVKNRLELGGFVTDFAFENGVRNWDGTCYKNALYWGKSIDDVDTTNYSAYLKTDKKSANLHVTLGVRYDKSKVRPGGAVLQERDFESVGANIFVNYLLDANNKLFFGFGQAQRIPDARELYFQDNSGIVIGTQTLQQVTNREADVGCKLQNDMSDLKIKLFYSRLTNYIYVNNDRLQNNLGAVFENIDAKVYGTELSGSYYVNEQLTFEAAASYKVGKKDSPLSGQSDRDLADIAPLEGKVGAVYEYAAGSYVRFDLQMRDKWSRYDADNGEVAISGWAVADCKMKHRFNKNIAMTLGVNNIFNTNYIRSNSYADLKLITTSANEAMLLNEPGRYLYANFDLKF